MKQQLLHTPEGVRDIYNKECEQKLYLESRLMQTIKAYGYRSIQTPSFEFFDIFGKDIGTVPSKDLYKFFDREGNTLVLRPDFTPSIARCAAKYYMESQRAIRLCYSGNSFINNNSYQGRLKERTQTGAELIGESSVNADAEILAMVVELLRTSGLTDFQISVGHVDFLNGLFEYSHFDEETEERIKTLLLNRNFYGVEEIVREAGLPDKLIALYDLLKDVMMTRKKLDQALVMAESYPTISNALQRLIELDELLRIYEVEKYVSFELALISSHDYYSGLIFAGYTYGSGEAVVAGGRYDTLLGYFGKPAPAIGFCITVDQLMAALTHQNLRPYLDNPITEIAYDKEHVTAAINEAVARRRNGQIVELLPLDEKHTAEFYRNDAKENHVRELIILADD